MATVAKFRLGQVVWTGGVNNKIAEDAEFSKFVLGSLARHATGDWGDMPEDDKKENEYSMDKHLRLMSSYENPLCRRYGLSPRLTGRGPQYCFLMSIEETNLIKKGGAL